jgi:hypothetical protein
MELSNSNVYTMSCEDVSKMLERKQFFNGPAGLELEKMFLRRAILGELVVTNIINNTEESLFFTEKGVECGFKALRDAESGLNPEPEEAASALLVSSFISDMGENSSVEAIKVFSTYVSELVKDFPFMLEFINETEV